MKPFARANWIWNSLAALSLANICFLTVWRELLFADAADAYWIPDYTLQSYVAIFINVFVLALILYGVIHYACRSSRPWLATLSRLLFISLLVFPLNYARIALGVDENSIHWLKDHLWFSMPIFGTLGLVGLYLLAFRLIQVARVIRVLLLVFSPFAFTNLAQVAWSAIELALVSTPPEVTNQRTDVSSSQRVLWLVMDELDLRLAFLDRPDGLVLPEFDRLRNQAFFARNTRSYSLSTEEAIPSFLLQKIVHRARPIGRNDLRLTFMDFENSADTKFSQLPNFFSESAARGARIAIIGYYHPYCRLFRKEAQYCQDYAVNTYSPYATASVLEEAWSQLLGITPVFRRINAIKTYTHGRGQIQLAAADPAFDLVFFHASVPHGPNIWDPESQNFTLFNTSKDGYFGNLLLADRLLGAVRRSMEQARLWDDTVVLLTSDHEWRHAYLYDNRRVRKIPFLLKMPGQKVQFEFAPSFAPMQVTKDLLLRILGRDLVTPEAVAQWLQLRINAQEKAYE